MVDVGTATIGRRVNLIQELLIKKGIGIDKFGTGI